MSAYNSLSEIEVNDLKIGLCPICNKRLTAECEHRTEESEIWLAAHILAEQTLSGEKWDKEHPDFSDPRTDEQRNFDEWQAETEATLKSAIRDGVSSPAWYDGQEEVEF